MESSSKISPSDTLSTAHQLLSKWDVLREREQLWSELHRSMGVFGKAISWQLPARLRLVGVVVQVVDALANPEMAPIVIDAVQQWILNVKREQALGKIDPLGLLSGLGCCMENKEATMESPFDGKRAGELEMQVVEAARTISLHLDYHVLEKALVATVVAKDFVQARRLIDELELLCKFLAVADVEVGCLGPFAEPSETQAVGSPQHVDRRRIDADAARGCDLMEDVERPRLDADVARSSAVTEDVEDTLTAMMEMGAEETQAEEAVAAEASPAEEEASMMPPTRSHGWASAASTQQQGEKRKCGAFDDVVEEIDQSPPRDQVVPSQNRASASSNPLFDSPLRAVASPLQQASASSALRPPRSQLFADSEVPQGVSVRGRVPWTMEEEQRLIDGYQRYGSRWEHIRQPCNLKHRTGTQLKDKITNLVKSGRVRKSD